MYRLGEVKHSHRKTYTWLGVCGLLIATAVILAAVYLKPNTQIGTTPALITKTLTYDTNGLITIDEPLFQIKLSADWKRAANSDDYPQPSYTWRGTSPSNSARMLQLWVDKSTLGSFAVNRELYLQANGSGVTILSDVSDNCVKFTGSANTQGHGNVPAKWQGIDFLCDTGNYERDVVGTASPDGLNNVNISGETKGVHHFFFAYTDNSASPDFTQFTNALKTFHVK